MLLERRKKKPKPFIPQCSMADVAFLLLIFFLTVSSLDLYKGLQIVLPPQGSKFEISQTKIASIFINDAGAVMMDEEEIPIMAIKDRLKVRLAKNPSLIVSIKTDRETPYQSYISVLDQVQMAEATQISIAEPEI